MRCQTQQKKLLFIRLVAKEPQNLLLKDIFLPLFLTLPFQVPDKLGALVVVGRVAQGTTGADKFLNVFHVSGLY